LGKNIVKFQLRTRASNVRTSIKARPLLVSRSREPENEMGEGGRKTYTPDLNSSDMDGNMTIAAALPIVYTCIGFYLRANGLGRRQLLGISDQGGVRQQEKSPLVRTLGPQPRPRNRHHAFHAGRQSKHRCPPSVNYLELWLATRSLAPTALNGDYAAELTLLGHSMSHCSSTTTHNGHEPTPFSPVAPCPASRLSA